jgi:hypothetical protein
MVYAAAGTQRVRAVAIDNDRLAIAWLERRRPLHGARCIIRHRRLTSSNAKYSLVRPCVRSVRQIPHFDIRQHSTGHHVGTRKCTLHAEAYCSVTESCCASRPNGAVRLVACEFMPLKQVDPAAYSVPECLITTYSHTVTASPAISETAAVVQLCNFSCAQLATLTTFQIVSCQLRGRFRRRS